MHLLSLRGLIMINHAGASGLSSIALAAIYDQDEQLANDLNVVAFVLIFSFTVIGNIVNIGRALRHRRRTIKDNIEGVRSGAADIISGQGSSKPNQGWAVQPEHSFTACNSNAGILDATKSYSSNLYIRANDVATQRMCAQMAHPSADYPRHVAPTAALYNTLTRAQTKYDDARPVGMEAWGTAAVLLWIEELELSKSEQEAVSKQVREEEMDGETLAMFAKLSLAEAMQVLPLYLMQA